MSDEKLSRRALAPAAIARALALLGAGLLVWGVKMVSIPAALIVAGALLLVVGVGALRS